MDYTRLTQLFEDDPAFGFIRARKAPIIASFLFTEFRQRSVYRISYVELAKRLADYLEYLQDAPEKQEETDTEKRARLYLDQWTDRGFLIKAPDDKTGEPYIELNTPSEKVLNWIDDALRQQRFIGTDSRFRDIFRKLKEVVELSTADPALRLAQLEQEQQKLVAEMEQIRQTGKVRIMEKHQVEENFIEISRMAKSLLADFKEVEKNFQRIGRDLYVKQTELRHSKGALLEIALHAWTVLKNEEQGKSFYGFWNFLQSDAQKEELRYLIQQFYQLLIDHEIPFSDDQFLKHLKRNLHSSGSRVLESNDRLAEKLNRVLAEKSMLERMRILELIKEIREYAHQAINDPPQDEGFMNVPVFEAEIRLPLNKRMVFGSEEDLVLQRQPEETMEIADFSRLFDQFYVDKKVLEDHIRQLLGSRSSVGLKEISYHFPIEKGLSEIIAYFAIAAQHPRHQISDTEQEQISYRLHAAASVIDVPKVVFYK